MFDDASGSIGSIDLLRRTMSPVFGEVILIDTPHAKQGTDTRTNVKNIGWVHWYEAGKL